MPSVVRSIRADSSEWERWVAAAGDVSLNAWVRRALNDRAQLDGALVAQKKAEDVTPAEQQQWLQQHGWRGPDPKGGKR